MLEYFKNKPIQFQVAFTVVLVLLYTLILYVKELNKPLRVVNEYGEIADKRLDNISKIKIIAISSILLGMYIGIVFTSDFIYGKLINK